MSISHLRERETGRAQKLYMLCNFKVGFEQASYALVIERCVETPSFAVI